MLFRPMLLAAIMAAAVAGCMAASVALSPTPVTLATGAPGGTYHAVGNGICRLFNLADEHQAVPCVAVSSEGSVANIERVERGESTFGLSQTDVAYGAFHGEGPFAAAGPDTKLRTLIALYPEALTVWCVSPVRRSTGCSRRTRITSLRSSPGASIRATPTDVATFGSLAVLVTSSNQPDAAAYGAVKAVFENFADFRRLHPALSKLDIKHMVPSEAVMPIHPGALKYFREAGLVR